jgi:hypothetical protein
MNAFRLRTASSSAKGMSRLTLFALVLCLAAASASPGLAVAPFKHTILVTTGPPQTPAQNGTALIAALASATPTGSARWLLRLEPGVYDLGTATLNMKNLVDIEGSGRDVTTITSMAHNSPVINFNANITAELRDLTVVCVPPTGQAYGVVVNSNVASLSRVNVVLSATDTSLGVLVSGAVSPVFTDVAVTAGSTANDVFGFYFQGSTPVVRNSSVLITTPNSMNVGIYQGQSGAATIDGLVATISGHQINIGIWVTKNCSLHLSRGDVAVSGGQAFGIENEGGGTVTVKSSTVAGIASGFGGFGLRQSVVPGLVVIEHSTFQGSDFSLASFNASTFQVAMTRLVKPISNNSPTATFSCAGAYNQSFALLNSGCL